MNEFAPLCSFERLLTDWLSERLPIADAADLETHLAHCVHCRESVEHHLNEFPTLLGGPWLNHPVAIDEAETKLVGSGNPRPGVAADGTQIPQTLIAPSSLGQFPLKWGRYEIEKEIGRGSFGIVYRAFDTESFQQVAIKVPLAGRFENDRIRQDFFQDALISATLEHPGIVKVLNVQADGDPPFIVQEYLSGGDLKQRLQLGAVTVAQAVTWMIPIAEAVAFMHQKDFFHRDLKPANILLDDCDLPRVADFGLALHESRQHWHKDELAGTLPYMSPEQVRRESNRLNGASDTWSLGVMLYEMLTGRRPFRGETEELIEKIKYHDPRPPRELKPDLPAELERICLRCLAKPAIQRYSTAVDLAEDLRNWQRCQDDSEKERPHHPARVVPKGLRSFDAGDVDFFLDLLPGPRDCSGLPECVRFWKQRIEQTNAEPTFSVGVLYGPSGSGKSSLVKAGLLPKLSPRVAPIFIEATAADTEVRLMRGLRKALPCISNDLSLPEMMREIRSGKWNPERKKILVVIDQFEQWLHGNDLLDPEPLIDALRYCDGEHLQGLVLVREDFWTGISRFMQRLEIPIQEQRNAVLVDRFEPRHARRILSEFGRALGRLPENLDELTRQQEQFLDDAIEQLSEDGRVICVRLALFAEMMKEKDWNKAALQHAGGAAGLGVSFLEETFAAKTAPQSHLKHKHAVQSLFRKLLPVTDTDIKASMQPRGELQIASGYSENPSAFVDLITILDKELRLITPTAPEGRDEREDSPEANAVVSKRYYQLTHDYLVPSVRRWLDLKNEETAAGRAKLLLEQRAASFTMAPQDRHLPSLWEFLNILLLTRQRDWSVPQQITMRRARVMHARWMAAGFSLMLVIVSLIWYQAEKNSNIQARMRVDAAIVDAPEAVRSHVTNLRPLSHFCVRHLRDLLDSHGLNGNKRLRALCLLAELGEVRPEDIVRWLDDAPFGDCANVVSALKYAPNDSIRELKRAAHEANKNEEWERKFRLAVVALHLGETSLAKEMLQIHDRPNPVQRTLFIDRFVTWHANLRDLAVFLEQAEDKALRSGMCLAVGSTSFSEDDSEGKRHWERVLQNWYQNQPDSTTHSAAGWALRNSKLTLPTIEKKSDEWSINPAGMTMLRLTPGKNSMPTLFYMQVDPNDEVGQAVEITWSYWICDREVTVGQWQQFINDTDYPKTEKPAVRQALAIINKIPAFPVRVVNFYDAVLFCNWLSRKHNLTPCYERTGEKVMGTDGIQYDIWNLKKTKENGYRLPTEVEWEYACRAGTNCDFACGSDEEMLAKYAVRLAEHPKPCGSKLPNGWGLFDMHGNVLEWCQDVYGIDDQELFHSDIQLKDRDEGRVVRGGCWATGSTNCRSSYRGGQSSHVCYDRLGFRVVRSCLEK